MTNLEKIKCKRLADDIADVIELTNAVYNAICETKREIFVQNIAQAYSLDAQPIARNQWISSPLTVAKMTLALECEGADNVLEIGCGSGYQAAIIAKIAHRVFTIERIGELANTAKKRFEALNTRNISVRYDDGNKGWSNYAPYDRIILSAATEDVPEILFKQLKVGGILVAPIVENGKQYITKYIKHAENDIEKIYYDECLFVPLLGGRA